MYTNTPLAPLNWRPIAILFGVVLLLAIVGALSSIRPTAQARPELQPIIMLATPTRAAPTPATRAILGYFDYDNPRSAVALNQADIGRVIGLAGDYRLVETRQGGRAWVALADVPANVPEVAPLANLAPPTAAPTPLIIYVPVELPAAPTRESRTGEKPSTKEAPTKVMPQQVR